LGKWLEGSTYEKLIFLLSQGSHGSVIHIHYSRVERICNNIENFVYHMINSNKMVTCTFCIIKEFKHINSECVLTKWKKAREPKAMIKRSKARILELVMQR
jgi:hypothetical protein